jgi:hypothetical protein
MKTFIIWLEELENEEAVKRAIQSAMGDMALGKEDSEWMDLDTGDLSTRIKNAILNLGEFKRFGHPERAIEVKNAVKNGIKIRDLIKLITSNHAEPGRAPAVLGGDVFV